jgi:hypothetical protein
MFYAVLRLPNREIRGKLTKAATGDCIFLSKLIIPFAQILVAQNLVGFADLLLTLLLVGDSG